MLESKSIISHIRIAFAVAMGIFLMTVAVLLLLATDEVLGAVLPRIPLLFIRLVVGIALYAVLASLTIRYLDKWAISRDSWKRWSIELLVLLVSVSLITLFESWFEIPNPNELKFDLQNRTVAIAFVNSVIGILMFMVYEIWTVIEANQKLQMSLTLNEKDKIALQLNSLKQKLNPHFLFNSLNVLSELMYEDKEKANEFIHQFSKVYRYVLDINEQAFVPVSKELDFLESYYFLQKIRFGKNLEMQIDLEPELLNSYLPPMAFQLLLENAIKHNEISHDRPLHFKVSSGNDFIIIENNMNPKSVQGKSTGVGHSNLISTYSLTSKHLPIFKKTEDKYIVKLPIQRKLP